MSLTPRVCAYTLHGVYRHNLPHLPLGRDAACRFAGVAHIAALWYPPASMNFQNAASETSLSSNQKRLRQRCSQIEYSVRSIQRPLAPTFAKHRKNSNAFRAWI